MRNWKGLLLKDIAYYSTDRVDVEHITLANYITTENMIPNRKGVNQASSFPSSRTVTKYSHSDILISNIRPYFKKIWFAENEGGCSNDVLVIRNKQPDNIDSKYLYYCLFTDSFFSYVMSGAKGAKMPRGDKDEIMKFPLSIPPLSIQNKVATFLSNIDLKIQLNIEMNQTLEEMAMAFYEYWFVDFGPFQNEEFVESSLGMIPKDWQVKKIQDAIEVVGGGTPKTKINDYWIEGSVNWYTPTDLTSTNSLFLTNSSKKITQLGLKKSSAKLFPAYSIMMTSRATLGEIAINRVESSTNQGFINIIPNEEFGLYYMYLWLKRNKEKIISISNGSTFKEVSKANFKNLDILAPKYSSRFENKVKPLFQQIESNLLENNSLIELRDYLLPKLLSGEVDLSEAKETVENVVR